MRTNWGFLAVAVSQLAGFIGICLGWPLVRWQVLTAQAAAVIGSTAAWAYSRRPR